MMSFAAAPADDVARLVARMLFEIEAVHFRPADPFTLASGLASPVYVDCRRIISFPRVRSAIGDFMAATVLRAAGFEAVRLIEPIGFQEVFVATKASTTARSTPHEGVHP